MTQTIKTNERELSGKFAEWLNFLQFINSLETNAYQKLHDNSLAEKMMKEIVKELGLE